MTFELRWLREPLYTIEDGERVVDVKLRLQYRTQVMQMGFGYSTGPSGIIHQYERPQGWTWTEWQDVPTADARDAAPSSGEKT